MKETKFTKEDGSEGTSYKLEAGDKVISRFSEPKKNEGGKFESWSLGITTTEDEPKELYIQITKGQFKSLQKAGDLNGKTITAEEYTNDFGTFVGMRVE